MPAATGDFLMGTRSPEAEKLPALSKRELLTLAPLLVLIILLGILPGPLVSIIDAALRSGPLGPIGLFMRGG